MADKNEVDYDALESHLTDPAVRVGDPQEVHSGEDATRFGREFMLREYGSEEAIVAAMRRPGRPRVGSEKRGPSPVVRGAIPPADFEALTALSQRTGKKQAVLVREAVHAYLIQQQAS